MVIHFIAEQVINMLSRHGKLSAPQIAFKTGLSPQEVNDALRELIKAEAVLVVGEDAVKLYKPAKNGFAAEMFGS